jgi:hypothetical protein
MILRTFRGSVEVDVHQVAQLFCLMPPEPLSGVPGGISAIIPVKASTTSQPVSKLRFKLYLFVLIGLSNLIPRDNARFNIHGFQMFQSANVRLEGC